MPARPDGEKKTLDRALSRAGAGSRTQAQEWIAAGRVSVNGRVATDSSLWVDPGQDAITLDGRPVRPSEKIHLAFHKPAGVVTARSDPDGRKTVYHFLKDVPEWVAPVGRLDRETSGLLLLTNDTAFADRITSPEAKVPKTYELKAATPLTDGQLKRLREGIELDDGPTLPAVVEVIRMSRNRSWLRLTITEGRNRQIRRMLRASASKVLELTRVAIGPVLLGNLATGSHRPLTPDEIGFLTGPRVRNDDTNRVRA